MDTFGSNSAFSIRMEIAQKLADEQLAPNSYLVAATNSENQYLRNRSTYSLPYPSYKVFESPIWYNIISGLYMSRDAFDIVIKEILQSGIMEIALRSMYSQAPWCIVYVVGDLIAFLQVTCTGMICQSASFIVVNGTWR
ncbi:7445_t:CDS:2 [Paraglomus occultum]|uniref:7445_t:CDS:1 n=1 Tax=Paraglomus occultum TaxID=144539 RepID=A0A9N9F6L9_9GLOM|nr:7445_t:CDS:2 [Paraglomus occultum]